MGDKRPNKYKAALASAKSTIDDERTTLAGDNGIGHSIKTKIATHEGWVCDEADTWVTEFTGKCTPVATDFDNAWSEVHAAWQAEPDEVPEDDWRATYFQYAGPYHPGMN